MTLNVQSFNRELESIFVFEPIQEVLIAVSGGIDSMVLCDLMLKSKKSFSIAHVNYALRGKESEEDAQFVLDYASKNNIRIFIKKLEKDPLTGSSGVQEKAREIRYAWFQEIMNEHQISYLFTAHHQNDQCETILFQFIRGGTFSALRGMLQKSDALIRPLLHYSKIEIAHYAEENEIAWREDVSNQTNKYTRNKFRHDIIPLLEDVNPGLVESLSNRAIIFNEAEQFLQSALQLEIEQHAQLKDELVVLPLNWLKQTKHPHLLLWQLLEPYAFSSHQVEEVIKLLYAHNGSRIESVSHQVWKREETLEICEIAETNAQPITITSVPFETDWFGKLKLSVIDPSAVSYDVTGVNQYIDINKLTFPLVLRSWKVGDRIQPLGMSQFQKISDLFIQMKIPNHKKGKIPIIESENEIVAVAGCRISENYRLHSGSKQVLHIFYDGGL
jgi:tRNA(Ile)-lysidine synthase